ncbi:Spc98 family-domain-containing protein [Suillus bovinus]|uniref:Spc98 family-domain-containing protein n=1 Tax=Suillus bovinus TaxID=48563 RepID=UPI001B884F5E|nr:Spc98 family-domain-containing protein [Suillus bovinus]XP_041302781.1 Spc98 family-domain-containing protein [Suillus bovinus]KAG2126974.1 Spc98 family-domain-containing protein [Suillus bovinus]KAG2132474.1 Spc98 family-domain-containing protein [Suillus bovinus]
MSLFSDAWNQHERDMDLALGILPHITSQFFVPRMVDKPQDPIVHAIDRENATTLEKCHTRDFDSRDIARARDIPALPSLSPEVLWANSVTSGDHRSDQVVSWDVLRQSFPDRSYNTPFLTEQSSDVSASAQYHTQPFPFGLRVNVVCVNELELLDSLRMTVLGTSSFLHTWDPVSETFLSSGGAENMLNKLIISGKDETMSSSLLKRFLDIGTLMRRLEVFLSVLRTRRKEESETVHAFSHALSVVLVYLRNQLSRGPLSNFCIPVSSKTLSGTWLYYEGFEEIVVSLASLCQRGLGLSPSRYPRFTMKPVALLSRIYKYLDTHFRKLSSRTLIAVFAYLLTMTSKNYLQALCRSVAYADSNNQLAATSQQPQRTAIGPLDLEDFDQASPEDDGVLFAEDDELPSFIPRDLVDALPAAQKSLKLLAAAKPGHPILNPPVQRPFITWVWSTRDIEYLWRTGSFDEAGDVAPTISSHSSPDLSSADANLHGCDYQPDLVGFRVFDLEPGSNGDDTFNEHSMHAALESFILSFPPVLPSITPSLSLLTSLVFSPLISHAASLSNALLSIFLDQNSFLYVHDHLVLLRSHMLLTSPLFKSRLTAALFSDTDDREVVAGGGKLFALSRQRSRSAAGVAQHGTSRWAVGLAPFLTERGTWPPGGADLSFFLRTVIVDSQDTCSFGPDDSKEHELGSRRIAQEAEVRLGFAIRDLSSDTGRERWLNPLYIEALDFLYLDYKVPHPLDVIITPGTTSKYQRIFSFLLRVIRVESAIRAAFRMTHQNVLFPTFNQSRKLLTHFRFVAHSFVNALSTYISDVAIGGNFDAFLARVTACRLGTSSEFTDVFSLADAHSAVLNDILSACLMRSAQQAAGDLLRGILELILELCVMIGDLNDGQLQEYQASLTLDALFAAFRNKMSTMIKVLEVLLEKDLKSSQRQELLLALQAQSDVCHAPGGVEALRHLTLRLDINEWWKNLNS